MPLSSDSIAGRSVTRSDSEPTNVASGHIWIDTSGNNVEINQYTGTTWELIIARGPDTPTAAYSVEGSLWRDTGGSVINVYTGAVWEAIEKTTEEVEDIVGAMAIGGLTYNDGAGTLSGPNQLHNLPGVGRVASGATNVAGTSNTVVYTISPQPNNGRIYFFGIGDTDGKDFSQMGSFSSNHITSYVQYSAGDMQFKIDNPTGTQATVPWDILVWNT